MPLTAKQQRFVEEYLVDLNATAAYKRAGYKAKTDTVARVEGARLLAKPSIAEAIQTARSRLSRQLEIKAAAVLEEYARIAFSDLGQIFDFTSTKPRLRPVCDIPEDARRALSSVKVRRYLERRGDDAREVEVIEFKLWDKLGGLSKLAEHLDLFQQKKPWQLDLTSGGKPLDRNSLTADDLAAIARMVAEASRAVQADGRSQPLDSADASSAAETVSAAL